MVGYGASQFLRLAGQLILARAFAFTTGELLASLLGLEKVLQSRREDRGYLLLAFSELCGCRRQILLPQRYDSAGPL